MPCSAIARVTLVALAALALASAGCGEPKPIPTPEVPPRLAIGINANTVEGGPAAQKLVAALGVTNLREELNWAEVEPQRDVFRTRVFDGMMAQAARRGMTVLPVLLGSPPWLSSDPTALPPADQWAGFVAAMVRRYGPGGRFWLENPTLDASLAPKWFELWNEPWFRRFSGNGVDPAKFAAMQVAAVRAGRQASSEVKYLMPAETAYTADDGTQRNWIQDVYAARPDIGAYADAIAAHPYGFGPPGSTEGSRRVQVLRLDDLIATLDAHGDGAIPIWLTEIGWSTCTQRPSCVSERDQASDLSELFTLVAQRWAGRVAAVYVYGLSDYDGDGSDDREAHFGMLRVDGTRKPAWYVLRRVATR